MIARPVGCVVRTLGDTILAALPGARIGDGVRVRRADGTLLDGEVAAVERGRVAIAPMGALTGVAVGDRVAIDAEALAVPVGIGALGRGFDAAGRPIDGGSRRLERRRSSIGRAHPSLGTGNRYAMSFGPVSARSTGCSRSDAARGSGSSGRPARERRRCSRRSLPERGATPS